MNYFIPLTINNKLKTMDTKVKLLLDDGHEIEVDR
jgi:hypothetical protein